MTLINILFLGILPIGLLMWAGNAIRTRAIANEKVGEDWLWFLSVGLGLSVIAFIIAMVIGDRTSNFTLPVLLPIIFGFAAALGLHLIQGRSISTGRMAFIFILIVFLLSWVSFANIWTMLLSFLLIAALTALAWLMWNQGENQYLLLFAIEVILLGISIHVTDLHRTLQISTEWLKAALSMGSYLFVPWAGVVLSALLIRRLLSNTLNWRVVTSTLLMVATLFSMIGYQAMLTSLWDVATDGLGWIFLWMTTSIIGIGSAMLMAWSMPRKRLWASILFALTIPLLLVEAHNVANYEGVDHKWGTKPIITTERRAEKIDNAIQRYYEKNNEYPQTLSELSPRYLLYIPNPYIIPGLDWCYEGSGNRYRFGYVYREYFSLPASVKIYSSAGKPFDTYWQCQNDADKYAHP